MQFLFGPTGLQHTCTKSRIPFDCGGPLTCKTIACQLYRLNFLSLCCILYTTSELHQGQHDVQQVSKTVGSWAIFSVMSFWELWLPVVHKHISEVSGGIVLPYLCHLPLKLSWSFSLDFFCGVGCRVSTSYFLVSLQETIYPHSASSKTPGRTEDHNSSLGVSERKREGKGKGALTFLCPSLRPLDRT